jgi:hypothetical protein
MAKPTSCQPSTSLWRKADEHTNLPLSHSPPIHPNQKTADIPSKATPSPPSQWPSNAHDSETLKMPKDLLNFILIPTTLMAFTPGKPRGHYLKNIPLLLARIIYEHYQQEVSKSDADLKQALSMLQKLKVEFPDLFSDDFEEYYKHRRTIFVKDLKFTVNSPPRKKESIEDLLYQTAYSDVPTHMRTPKHPVYKIYLQGTSAIPELVLLSTSRKITPAIQGAIMNSPESRLRLGHLASKILTDMTGAQAVDKTHKTLDGVWKTWLTKADLSDEKEFLLSTLEKPKGDRSINAGIPLSILFHKHPKSTINLAGKLSESKHRSDFTSALMASTIDKATKGQALQIIYAKQKGLARRYMLQNLAKIDPDTAAKEIIPLIKNLPKDVTIPYWTAEEANLSHVVMQLEDPAVWKAYLTKAKTCSVGLRMEFMNSMNYTYVGDANRDFRLAFLAAFLNDTTVRTTKKNDPRWNGPHAGFTYDTLSVQNFVAQKIASILKVPGQPADYWTVKQWAPYRKQVEQALKKLTLPDLAE